MIVASWCCRQEGQGTAEEVGNQDLRAKLEEKERKHIAKTKGVNFEEERKKDMKLLEQIGADPGGGGKAPKALIPKAADADDEDEDESESSSSSGDDDDDVRHARGASGLFSPCMRQWFILTFHARRTRSHPACARDSLYPARAQMHALALWALIQRLWVVIHRQMHALALWVGIQRLWVVIQRLRVCIQ